MDDSEAGPIHLVHHLPGRARIHLPGRDAPAAASLGIRLRLLPGVHEVRYNPETANLLVRFDPERVAVPSLLSFLQRAAGQAAATEAAPPASRLQTAVARVPVHLAPDRARSRPLLAGLPARDGAWQAPISLSAYRQASFARGAARAPLASTTPARDALLAAGFFAAARLLLRVVLGPEGAALALRLIAIGKALLIGDARYPLGVRLALALLGT